jgi:hypothetical protein
MRGTISIAFHRKAASAKTLAEIGIGTRPAEQNKN